MDYTIADRVDGYRWGDFPEVAWNALLSGFIFQQCDEFAMGTMGGNGDAARVAIMQGAELEPVGHYALNLEGIGEVVTYKLNRAASTLIASVPYSGWGFDRRPGCDSEILAFFRKGVLKVFTAPFENYVSCFDLTPSEHARIQQCDPAIPAMTWAQTKTR